LQQRDVVDQPTDVRAVPGTVDDRVEHREPFPEPEARVNAPELFKIYLPDRFVQNMNAAKIPRTVYSIYWPIPPTTYAGMTAQVRSTVAALVGELRESTDPLNSSPTPEVTEQAVRVVLGD